MTPSSPPYATRGESLDAFEARLFNEGVEHDRIEALVDLEVRRRLAERGKHHALRRTVEGGNALDRAVFYARTGDSKSAASWLAFGLSIWISGRFEIPRNPKAFLDREAPGYLESIVRIHGPSQPSLSV